MVVTKTLVGGLYDNDDNDDDNDDNDDDDDDNDDDATTWFILGLGSSFFTQSTTITVVSEILFFL